MNNGWIELKKQFPTEGKKVLLHVKRVVHDRFKGTEVVDDYTVGHFFFGLGGNPDYFMCIDKNYQLEDVCRWQELPEMGEYDHHPEYRP